MIAFGKFRVMMCLRHSYDRHRLKIKSTVEAENFSLLLPFFVSIAIVENTPLLPLVVGTMLLLLACGLIFLTVNALMWRTVYKLFTCKNTKREE